MEGFLYLAKAARFTVCQGNTVRFKVSKHRYGYLFSVKRNKSHCMAHFSSSHIFLLPVSVPFYVIHSTDFS